MPHVLIAGTVVSPPKSYPFPDQGRPYASVVIDADDVEYKVIAHDMEMADIESLQPGDSVSVQGTPVLVNEKGRLGGLYIRARQINPLRTRSRNRLPISMAKDAYL